MRVSLFVYVVLFIFLVSCTNSIPSVTVHGKTFIVEVAKDEASRENGLMNRSYLEKDKGMLFIFDTDAKQSFWMKNTLIPLDILFINSTLSVVDIKSMIPCISDSCSIYESNSPAMYALEINKGESEGIVVGDKIILHI